MILFPNAKINLGLRILRRRPDGYHDIDSVLVPIGWSDILEIVPAPAGESTSLTCTGRPVACPPEKNLVMKAWRAMAERFPEMPQARIFLRKIVPDGAGLGGGSSDAAFTLLGLNELFGCGLDTDGLASIAATIGADCPFFIYNRPMLVSGTGTTLAPADTDLDGLHIAIAKPEGRSVSTAEAYAGVTPHDAGTTVADALAMPRNRWQRELVNDFEPSVGARLPEIDLLKARMLAAGAVYTAMSGSGSAVFGLFESANLAERAVSALDDCACWTGLMKPQGM
ncbi:MAG: 4-(cytidine 5'-diphospho)-2-C-methyl-D-erythritol kinase [Muribaculaceae bacterium]|nr:4-(cytidine 5'-diphospho)-2-C-methyl-D-erythritol kinase [Muribaculaceae bacterium]